MAYNNKHLKYLWILFRDNCGCYLWIPYANTSLVQIERVNTKGVQWYAGKTMAYNYKGKVKTNGSHYRCIWGKVIQPHGSCGVFRVKFTSNLPPKSMVRENQTSFLCFCI
ncbi:hypothetical protein MKX01_024835 [Papaver californicum]|nr:hypothetical protein MKX01_024835 [Papaver californicum]